jgi:hypothetical protein
LADGRNLNGNEMKTALYTTIFPVALPYVQAWSDSVTKQSDQDFELWIALDGVNKDEIPIPRAHQSIHWFMAESGATVAQIREAVFREMMLRYEAIIFTDSDDVLLPERVAAAKHGLQNADVYACAMQLIDTNGTNLKLEFNTNHQDWETLLISQNVFGLSNTAYRTDVLSQCLNFPVDTVMVDWLMVMKALDAKARLVFDTTAHMLYRQYANNTARVLSPYTEAQIIKATELVLDHYEKLIGQKLNVKNPHLEERSSEVQHFFRNMADETLLTRYTKALNALKPVFLWWECVAHPELSKLWSKP